MDRHYWPNIFKGRHKTGPCKKDGFQSLPTGRFAKPCRVLSPACVLTSPTARHFDTAKVHAPAVRKPKGNLFLNV